jgi:3-deoxy-D-manno-octulosonic-acid transferase
MEKLLLFFYDIGLLIVLALVAPISLIKKKFRAGLFQKFGFLPQSFRQKLRSDTKTIWLHAVSVGEFTAVLPFIEILHSRYPDIEIVISTTTETGNRLAQERVGKFAAIFYFPFDLSWVVRRVLDTVHPSMVFFAETELWPCFTNACSRLKIPLVILNGRISPRSFNSYKLLTPIFAPLLKKFSLIGTQSKIEAQRYESIAGTKLPTIALGNLKYDNLSIAGTGEAVQLREQLGINANDLVLVAGSTHETEEHLVLRILERLQSSRNRSNRCRLIIAPRHPERFERVCRIIESFGRKAKRYSHGEKFESEQDVYVLDIIGVLAKHYAVASVAFVGGTIAKVGGHNLLEPYAYGVPVVCGPCLFKTKETAKILKEEGALLIGNGEGEVEELLSTLVVNQHRRQSMGEAGRNWLIENQGAVNRAFVAVERLMAERGLVDQNGRDKANAQANDIIEMKMLETSQPTRSGGKK